MSAISIDTLNSIVLEKFKQNEDEYLVFIETGTCVGETVFSVQPYFKEVYTIEISEKHFSIFNTKKEELSIENIKNYLGDSTYIIPEILNSLSGNYNCIFWLDGHWSSGDTGRGEKDCPLIEECQSIDNLCKSKKSIVLIDDYRLFGSHINEDWSNITEENILNCFKNYKVINKIIFNDIFCLLVEKN